MNWVENIKDGIERYHQQVIPYVEQGFYGAAGLEIGNSIYEIIEGCRSMPISKRTMTIGEYTKGLIARFELFRKYCFEEGLEEIEHRQKVKRVRGMIEERIHLVEIGVNACLED